MASHTDETTKNESNTLWAKRGSRSTAKSQVTLRDLGGECKDRVSEYSKKFVWRIQFDLELGKQVHDQVKTEMQQREWSPRSRLWMYIKLSSYTQGDGWIPWLELKPSLLENDQIGVFTLREFLKGEIVGWVCGRSKSETSFWSDPKCWDMGMHFIQNPICRGAKHKGASTWRKVNCVVNDEGCVYTTKAIHKGMELYGDLNTVVEGEKFR